jgi:hypothetical protein
MMRNAQHNSTEWQHGEQCLFSKCRVANVTTKQALTSRYFFQFCDRFISCFFFCLINLLETPHENENIGMAG